MVRALKELKKVMEIEGIDRKSGRIAREKALEQWEKEWVVEVSNSQSVIKQNLTSEEDDFLKYYLAYQMGDKLMEDCITVEVDKNKFTTKIKALRR